MNPLENKLILQYLSGAGAAMSAGEPIGPAVGQITQQNIASQNFVKMLKSMLASGGKLNLDKDNLSFKAPTSIFGEGTKMGEPTGTSGLGTMDPRSSEMQKFWGGEPKTIPTKPTFDLGDLLNPSVSPLDMSAADLAGLTTQDITQALQLKFAGEELKRKKMADVVEETYYGAATRRMEAETAKITPSIEVPGLGRLTRKEAIDWYKATSKDERTAALKNYEYAVNQGFEGSFEDWMMRLAALEGGIPEFAEKKRIGEEIKTESKLAGPDYAQTVREDLMKDRDKWGTPPTYRKWKDKGYDEAMSLELGRKSLTLKEMDSRIRSFYKGKKVERRQDGWYVDGELKVRNPYAGD